MFMYMYMYIYIDLSATPIGSDKRSRSFSANLSRRLNSQRRLQALSVVTIYVSLIHIYVLQLSSWLCLM